MRTINEHTDETSPMIITREQLFTWVERDPSDQLDHAMAGQRLLSRAIAEATERRDTRAMRALSDLSHELGGEVDRLLKVADRMVGHV